MTCFFHVFYLFDDLLLVLRTSVPASPASGNFNAPGVAGGSGLSGDSHGEMGWCGTIRFFGTNLYLLVVKNGAGAPFMKTSQTHGSTLLTCLSGESWFKTRKSENVAATVYCLLRNRWERWHWALSLGIRK